MIETGPILSNQEYPRFTDYLPAGEMRDGRYVIRFVKTHEELDAALRLRFEIFNLELGEGLESSFLTGRDIDEYDISCHHLIVLDKETNVVVGTYRLQTGAMAAAAKGFYAAAEFDLSSMPQEMLDDSIELGRACIARSHRNSQVLFLLWKGIASYIAHNRKRYLFGCCSLTSENPRDGLRAMELLKRDGRCHPTLEIRPRAEFDCDRLLVECEDSRLDKLPRLFRTYLRFGAKVCSRPAIDREFKTIDFFVLFDVFEMSHQNQKLFFGA